MVARKTRNSAQRSISVEKMRSSSSSFDIPKFDLGGKPATKALRETIADLETEKQTLTADVSSLSQRLHALGTEYSSKQKTLEEGVSSFQSMLTDLQHKQHTTQERAQFLTAQQGKIQNLLDTLDSEKQSIVDKEAKLEQSMSSVEKTMMTLSQKQEELDTFNKTLVDKEQRLSVKEQELQMQTSAVSSKRLTLDSKYAELTDLDAKVTSQSLDLQKRERLVQNKFSQLKLQHVDYLKHKHDFSAKANQLQAKAKILDSRELSMRDLLYQLESKQVSLQKEMSEFQSVKKEILEGNLTHKGVETSIVHAQADLANLNGRKTSLTTQITQLESEYDQQLGAKLSLDTEFINLRSAFDIVTNNLTIKQASTKNTEEYLVTQKNAMSVLATELTTKELALQQRELSLQQNESRFETKETRLESKLAQIAAKETFIIQQQESLKEEEAKVYALELQQASLSESITELETRERDMNLKTLGFDKREEALLILETALEKRDQMISDKEAASTPLQLRAAITQLKGELGAVIEEKETLQKKLEAELKEDSEAHIKLAELQQKYSSLQAELKAVREKEIKVETEIDSANASKGALKSEIKDLQKTLHDLEEEKVRSVDIDEDVRTVLEITDQLLEHLPDHVLKRFVQSTNFSIFQKVFKKYNVE